MNTLHKMNLFSLGEERLLTIPLMKHFLRFKTKLCPDTVAHTTRMAPEPWRILFSKRRRWINSTVHNLCELAQLAFLPELFSFCCFFMRFFVLLDPSLIGTIVSPLLRCLIFFLADYCSSRIYCLPLLSTSVLPELFINSLLALGLWVRASRVLLT